MKTIKHIIKHRDTDDTKYIIEYVAGCKGDMLVGFLNNATFNMDSTRKTHPMKTGCPHWLKLVNPYDLTLDRFEEILGKNQWKFLASHPLWVLYNKDYKDLLKKYNYKIYSIKFEPEHYVTIYIEAVLKTMFLFNKPHGVTVINLDSTGRIGNFNKYIRNILNVLFFEKKQIPQWIYEAASEYDVNIEDLDIWNLETDPKKLRFDRSSWFGDGKIPFPLWAYTSVVQTNKLFNEMTEDRTLLYYDHLYLRGYPFPHLPDREEEWNTLVENSWCDYDGHGYRKFENTKKFTNNPYFSKNQTPPRRSVLKYLEQWKPR